MIYCIDVDDTLCKSNGRDYKSAKLIEPTAARLRTLHSEGHTIILYTARGMLSCNGNARLIEDTVRPTLVQWLWDNRVPYKTLVMGKPYADVYVDDKGMSLEDFQSGSTP
jgi:capsule biosynthesis phosphatase